MLVTRLLCDKASEIETGLTMNRISHEVADGAPRIQPGRIRGHVDDRQGEGHQHLLQKLRNRFSPLLHLRELFNGAKPVLILCLAVCQPLVAQPTEYFVSPSGSPTNSGTVTSPWPSVGFALNNATGGDVITLLPGTYAEAVVVGLSGTAEHPTVLRSQPKWQAVIQGSPSHGIYIADGVSNVVIDGLQVVAAAIDGVKVGSYATVRNCWIHDSAHQGISGGRTRVLFWSAISLSTMAATRCSIMASI